MVDNPAAADSLAVRQTAERLLARREYATRELRQRLLGRGFDAGMVDEVITVLGEENLLSDERFAETWVHARMRRGDGPLKLRAALAERGIEPALIARLVPEDYDSWVEPMREVREQRFGAPAPANYAEWARQARFLQRRGFPPDHIRRLLRAAEGDDSGD